MKYYLSILITFFSIGVTYGQLNLNKEKPVPANGEAVERYLKNNHIDYALVAWTTSNWVRSQHSFHCLIKQHGSWYVATLISSETEEPPAFNMNLKVNQFKLNAKQADSLMVIIKPDSAFKYTEMDLLKLPETPTYKKNGVNTEYSISDAGTVHLIRFEYDNANYLTYYAPAQIVQAVSKYAPEYNILRGLIYTTDMIASATKNFKLW